jgi:hypothetical protein
MIEHDGKVIRCDECGLRKRSEEKPNSLLGRFWRWHINWCPGWKAYQAYLAEQETKVTI